MKTAAGNITEFRNLDQLEMAWNTILEFVDGDGNRQQAPTLFESLKGNNACFHKVCGYKYDKQKPTVEIFLD